MSKPEENISELDTLEEPVVIAPSPESIEELTDWLGGKDCPSLDEAAEDLGFESEGHGQWEKRSKKQDPL